MDPDSFYRHVDNNKSPREREIEAQLQEMGELYRAAYDAEAAPLRAELRRLMGERFQKAGHS